MRLLFLFISFPITKSVLYLQTLHMTIYRGIYIYHCWCKPFPQESRSPLLPTSFGLKSLEHDWKRFFIKPHMIHILHGFQFLGSREQIPCFSIKSSMQVSCNTRHMLQECLRIHHSARISSKDTEEQKNTLFLVLFVRIL